MTVLHHPAQRRASEGTLSARQINSAPLTPEPYLLDKGPFPIRRPEQQKAAHKPLRLIKPAHHDRSACGFGTCAVTPECTGRCSIQQADEALRSHYSAHHTQRAAMPPVAHSAPAAEDHRGRPLVWALLIAWCVGCLGVAAWVAWPAVRALLTA